MRIEGDIYFNPKTKWSKINTDQIDDLINQYHERIKGYYLLPVHQLLAHQSSQILLQLNQLFSSVYTWFIVSYKCFRLIRKASRKFRNFLPYLKTISTFISLVFFNFQFIIFVPHILPSTSLRDCILSAL